MPLKKSTPNPLLYYSYNEDQIFQLLNQTGKGKQIS